MKDLCRCGHLKPMHITWSNGGVAVSYDVTTCIGYRDEALGVCPCKSFIPDDNLEFLELEAAKRGK